MKLGEITETAVVQTAHLAQIPKMGIWVTAEQLVKKLPLKTALARTQYFVQNSFPKV